LCFQKEEDGQNVTFEQQENELKEPNQLQNGKIYLSINNNSIFYANKLNI
jgi:hypothetical protein